MSVDSSSRELAIVLMEEMEAEDIFEGLLGIFQIMSEIETEDRTCSKVKHFPGYYVQRNDDCEEDEELDCYIIKIANDNFFAIRVYPKVIYFLFNENKTIIKGFFLGEQVELSEQVWYTMMNGCKQLLKLHDSKEEFKKLAIKMFKIFNYANEI